MPTRSSAIQYVLRFNVMESGTKSGAKLQKLFQIYKFKGYKLSFVVKIDVNCTFMVVMVLFMYRNKYRNYHGAIR